MTSNSRVVTSNSRVIHNGRFGRSAFILSGPGVLEKFFCDSLTLKDEGGMFLRNVGENNPAARRHNPQEANPENVFLFKHFLNF
jgi:hypothetical protein